MLALGIRYLCGWSMATDPSDRKRPEWPPHPDRIFQAMVAAHFETDGGLDEYEALRRLSQERAPGIFASPHHERDPVTAFVPVNGDKAADISREGSPLLPQAWAIRRSRQAREFPVAIPEQDVVYLIWPDADLAGRSVEALGGLCRKVTAIGHSASLVQMWIEPRPPEPNLSPCEWPEATRRLRAPYPGRIEELQALYEAEVRPLPTGWVGYAPGIPAANRRQSSGTSFDPGLVVLRRVAGSRFGLESTLLLTDILRKTVIKHCPEPVPEWISGHDGPDGPRSRHPHLAFLPLADVDHNHAEGRLLGMALAIPLADREGPVSAARQREALGPLLLDDRGWPGIIPLRGGGHPIWDLALEDRESRPMTLRPEAWTASDRRGGAKAWATVTPIVLDRYPKADGEAEEIVARACLNIGLPEPVEVVVSSSPRFVGVPHARRYPPYLVGPGRARRFHTHATIRFGDHVEGPVLLGAGRYRGYGFCRPLRGEAG